MPEIGHEYEIYNFIPTTDPDVPLMVKCIIGESGNFTIVEETEVNDIY